MTSYDRELPKRQAAKSKNTRDKILISAISLI